MEKTVLSVTTEPATGIALIGISFFVFLLAATVVTLIIATVVILIKTLKNRNK